MTPRPKLIGVPYDASSSFLSGPATAPAAIRAALASPSSNSWSETGIDLSKAIDDGGDLDCSGVDPRAAIEKGARAAMTDQPPIFLGGDHSITYPLLRAFRERHARLTILHIDAHSDLYDVFEGDRFSHACPFARIMEERLADQLIQVGIRTLTAHLRDQAKRFGVEIVEMRDWVTGRRPAVGNDPVYISLDVDALDPAFAPGVSHWEPGGLSTRDVITLIQELRSPIVGADVVELNPVRDPSGMTAMVAAKLVKEIAAKMIAG